MNKKEILERLETESNELGERILKARAAVTEGNDVNLKIPEKQIFLIKQQVAYMQSYQMILRKRINLIKLDIQREIHNQKTKGETNNEI